ncbi:MAG: hypothetical protein IJL26_07690 [Clostridia bacterium]|nr:hypothetical protein [Clostridia bacterium]
MSDIVNLIPESEGSGMNEAYNVIDKYILPFLNFIKKIINSIVKLLGQPTVFAED